MNDTKKQCGRSFFFNDIISSRHPAVRVDAWWQHNHTPAKMAVPAVWSRDAGVLCGVWIGCAVHQCGVRWKKIVKKERRRKRKPGRRKKEIYCTACTAGTPNRLQPKLAPYGPVAEKTYLARRPIGLWILAPTYRERMFFTKSCKECWYILRVFLYISEVYVSHVVRVEMSPSRSD